MDIHPDQVDVQLARQGDQEAFVRLIKQYEPTLYRVAASILRSDTECVDAAQEAILLAYASIHTLKEAAYFKTWLIRILMHECYRMLKKNRNIIPLADGLEPPFASAKFGAPQGSAIEQQLDLREAIHALEQDLQLVVSLYYWEDLPVKDIAALLEIPAGTVKSRLSRARQKLAERLNPVQVQKGC